MAQYEKVFIKPYEDGYENLPSQNTPITAQTLNDKDTAIEHIEDFLDGKEFPTAEDESAWDGAVSDIKYYKETGYLSLNLCNNATLEQGDIDGTGHDSVDGSANHVRSKNIIVKSNTVYTLSYDHVIPAESGTFKVMAYQPDGTFIQRMNTSSTARVYTFTTPANCGIVRIVIFDTTGVSATNIKIQLEEGSTATAYMQYAPSNIELANSKADITAIGTDETGRTTASRQYVAGEHFNKDGKFCTTKTGVAQGATWTLNTNYVEGDVATELRGTGNVGISTTGYTQSNYELVTNNLYMRNGRVVMYLFVRVLDPSLTVFIDIGVLPDSIDKPLTDILDTSMSFDGGYNGGIPFQYSINPTTGKVAVRGGVVGCRYPATITY